MRISSKPTKKTFRVEIEGYDEPLNLTIRQATAGDNIKRADLISEASLVIRQKSLDQEIKQRINVPERGRFEAYLTLEDCDLVVEETGKEWFAFVNGRIPSLAKFNEAWDTLPVVIANAIGKKVLEVNPDWGGNAEDDDPLG